MYIHILYNKRPSFTVLNQENDELTRQLNKQQHPSVMVTPVNPNGVQQVSMIITDIV